MDGQRLEVAVRDELEELDHAGRKAFGEMARRLAVGDGGQVTAVALDDELAGQSIAQQAMEGHGALEAFAERGTGRQQVLEHLPAIKRHVLAEMQTDVGITGDVFRRLPEHELRVAGGAGETGFLEPAKGDTGLQEDLVGREAGIHESLVGQAQEDMCVGAFSHAGKRTPPSMWDACRSLLTGQAAAAVPAANGRDNT